MSEQGKVRRAQALARVAAWERFLERQSGCFPASLAAAVLSMSMQGVYQAAERGWIEFFSVGRVRYYGRKDVLAYRWTGSRKFSDNRPLPPHRS